MGKRPIDCLHDETPKDPMSRMRRLGPGNAQQRHLWLKEHEGEIIEYAKTHSRTEVCAKFNIGVPTFKRLCGSYKSVAEAHKHAESLSERVEAINAGSKLSDYMKGMLLMYDMASKEAGSENKRHKREFVKMLLFVDNLSSLAEKVIAMKLIDYETEKIVNCTTAVLKAAFPYMPGVSRLKPKEGLEPPLKGVWLQHEKNYSTNY